MREQAGRCEAFQAHSQAITMAGFAWFGGKNNFNAFPSVGNHPALSVHAAAARHWPTPENVGPASRSSGAQCANPSLRGPIFSLALA